ncbi:AAA family ATPase [Polymorphobacter sp. PAMC 29334]|nr:AAA family ATPase [Polymorphobacter sp. PAMC 29334]
MILDTLGCRICIMGPSGSGKSTLATAIGRSRGLPPIYLDQLYHRPDTNWQPRPAEEFTALHDEALLGARWVMDGNYSRSLPQRLARATGVILLDVPVMTSLLRYLRRAWFERDRHGGLEGGRDSARWAMIHHIAVVAPHSRRRYAEMFGGIGLPKVSLVTTQELTRFYRLEGLDR